MSTPSQRFPRALYTASEVRALDQRAIESGIAGIDLMRRAAESALQHLLGHWPQTRRVLVWAGSGNNAGDGYLLAKLAHEQGLEAAVLAIADPSVLDGDAATAYAQATAAGVEVLAANEGYALFEQTNSVWVDALFGTGLQRELTGDFRRAVECMNAASMPVLALDIPSGLSADTGAVFGVAVKADATVTFVALKRGLFTLHANDLVGELHLSDLGIPKEIIESSPASVQRLDIYSSVCSLPPRARNSHKGSHGHVLVVGGDNGYGGACVLAAEAALSSGAGLVSVVTRSVNRAGILARRPELMVVGTEDGNGVQDSEWLRDLLKRASAIVIGPGLGRGEWGRQLWSIVKAVAKARSISLVIDADGLFFLHEDQVRNTHSEVSKSLRPWVITPHPGEAALLLDSSIPDIQRDRFAAVASLASRYRCQALIKGAGSVLCIDKQQLLLCTEGNAGMAVAGMGDVLSGLVGGLIAQGLTPTDALQAAVSVHGEAGDLAAAEHGQRGLMASELFPEIRRLLN